MHNTNKYKDSNIVKVLADDGMMEILQRGFLLKIGD